MLAQSKQLVGARIVSLHTGQVIGRLESPIINPQKLQLLGFYVDLPRSKQRLILLTQDIRQFGQGRVFINSFDELSKPGDLLRQSLVINLNFNLIDKVVRSVSRQRLGKVSEYVADTALWQVQKLYVSQPFFKSLSVGTLVIDRTQIIDVTERQVTVADAAVTTPAVAPSRVPNG